MIPLTSSGVSRPTLTELTRQQRAVSKPVVFADQVAKAQVRWDAKKRSKTGKAAFAEIQRELVRMTVSEEACAYCEHNEGRDIEHVYPKSWFPERAFVWDNYLLACQNCNSNFKRDRFAVFNPAGSATLFQLTAQTPGQPPTSDGVLLNPRAENPLNYLELDFLAGLAFVPRQGLSPRDDVRALYTRELLQLNLRPELRKARAIAYRHYIGLLDEYVKVKASTSLATLRRAVHVPNVVVAGRPFVRQRAEILVALRRAVRTHPHPSVWYEIKNQYALLPEAPNLIAKAPEALSW